MGIGVFVIAMCGIPAGAEGAGPGTASGATLLVAAHDASERAKLSADFLCDGAGDQEEINAAIRALPPAGGVVQLTEGTFDIRKVPGKLGGILIERSHVVLAGRGAATRLALAPDQNTNVVRIIGAGVGHITIRDLEVDANRSANSAGTGDPNIGHDRFEFCGIKAYCMEPGQYGAAPTHNITIRNTRVIEAHRLGIMLEGPNMSVVDNHIGNAGSDSIEILTGPGEIRGNYMEITGRTHVAIGSDRADAIIMADNIVHVKEGGDLDIAFRSWADSRRHVIANNVLTVDPGGRCRRAVDARGAATTIIGNCFHTADEGEPLLLSIGAGDVVVSGNVFENVTVEIDDITGQDRPIVLGDNAMLNSTVRVVNGKVIGARAPETLP